MKNRPFLLTISKTLDYCVCTAIYNALIPVINFVAAEFVEMDLRMLCEMGVWLQRDPFMLDDVVWS